MSRVIGLDVDGTVMPFDAGSFWAMGDTVDRITIVGWSGYLGDSWLAYSIFGNDNPRFSFTLIRRVWRTHSGSRAIHPRPRRHRSHRPRHSG